MIQMYCAFIEGKTDIDHLMELQDFQEWIQKAGLQTFVLLLVEERHRKQCVWQ